MTTQELIKAAEDRIKDFKELQRAGLICLDGDFFPSVHYPPITMYPPISEEALFEGYQNPQNNKFVVYAHFPFCKKYCNFCHYPNKIGDSPEEKNYYLKMIVKEIDIYMKRLGLERINARSILVGGGTPTYLSPVQLDSFLRAFTSRIDLTHCTQFNYDVDPQTIIGPEGKERLKIMKFYGVDRITIGIQSLDDEILKKMDRHHTAEEAVESIHQAKDFGFQLNIEFIFGYPEQTLNSWMRDMEMAVSFGVEEIQLYRMKFVPHGDHTGLIANKFAKQKEDLSAVEQTLLMKQFAILFLAENGYHENLRRVFTKEPKYFSHYAHDQCCNLFDQIGFGLTAFSSLRDRFGLNTKDFKEYYSSIEQGKLPVNRGLVRKRDDQLRWHIILPLKNRNVIKKQYQRRTNVSLNDVFRRKIEKLKGYGLLHEDDEVLDLTQRGSFYADEVCHQFNSPDFKPFPGTAFMQGNLHPYIDTTPD